MGGAFAGGGLPGALGYAGYLVGRHAIFILARDVVYAIPDCGSTYAIFLHCSADGIVFSSNYNLLAVLCGLPRDESIGEAMSSPEYKAPQGKSMSAKWTSVEGVVPVFANCFASYSLANGTLQHRRFYPFGELPSLTVDSAYERFRERFLRGIAAVSKGQDILLPITAGLDSTTTLLALLKTRQYRHLSTFTYLRRAIDSNFDDAIAGNRISTANGLLHRLLPLDKVDADSEFFRYYRETFCYGAQFPNRAAAIHEHTPHGHTKLVSTGSEIGRAYHKLRDAPLSPETLARKFTTSSFQHDPRLVSAFADYIDYVEFQPDRFLNYDFHDLFYWEHRLTKWGALGFSEYDLSGFSMTPFKDRKLMEIMLSIPLDDRQCGTLQNRFILDLG